MQPATLVEETPPQAFFCEICENFKNIYSEDYLWTTASAVSQGSMFIIHVIDLSTKNKIQRRGFTFLQKSKIKALGNIKKKFSVNSFRKVLIFHICISSENAQCFVGAFL